MKKCLFPGCGAILNQYNAGKLCDLHTRLCFLREIEFIRGKFYTIVQERRGTKTKNKKVLIPNWKLKVMKIGAREDL